MSPQSPVSVTSAISIVYDKAQVPVCTTQGLYVLCRAVIEQLQRLVYYTFFTLEVLSVYARKETRGAVLGVHPAFAFAEPLDSKKSFLA